MRFSSFALGLVAVSVALVAAAPVPSADTTALVQRGVQNDGGGQHASNSQPSSSNEANGVPVGVTKDRQGSKSSDGTHGSTSDAASDGNSSDSESSMSDSGILDNLTAPQLKEYNTLLTHDKKKYIENLKNAQSSSTTDGDEKIVCSLK